MATSTDGLVPITRSFLARYYDKYPVDPLPDDVAWLTGELRRLACDLVKEFPPTPGDSPLLACLDFDSSLQLSVGFWISCT